MKISKIVYGFLFFAVLGVALNSCKDDEELFPQLGVDPKNIIEIASETPELSSFLGLITTTELDSLLSVSTTYTVFAPNNDAVGGIPTPADDEELENIMLNHILQTVTPDFTSTMTTGYLKTMAIGPDDLNLSFYTNTEGGLIFNGVASPVDGLYDIGATNGIVHTVDAVLMPPTVADHAKANPNYSSFVEAMELAEFTVDLEAEGPFTLFAPNNTAFESFMTAANGAFGWENLSDVPVEVLDELLSYHVVTGENIESDALDGSDIETVQGEILTINGLTIDDASYVDANIDLTDIQGVNGIIHGIDKVLITEELFQNILSETLSLYEQCDDKGYSSFLAAVDKVGLSEDLMNTELTVFAPNNGAFDIFLLTIENYDSLDDFVTTDDLALLKSVVEYHLSATVYQESDLIDGSEVTTVQGDVFTVDGTSLVPSHSEANSANLLTTNIGATNGVLHELDVVLVSDTDASGLGYPLPATGGPVYGYEIYHDELNPVFWIGWTTPETFSSSDQVKSGLYSIKMNYAGWDGFQIGGAGEDLTQYSTIDFSLYSETGTTLLLVLNEQWGNGQMINVPAGEWSDFTIPIANVSNGTTILDQFVLQDQTGGANTVYIDQVGLDITHSTPPPVFSAEIYHDELNPAFWIGWTVPETFSSTEQVRSGLYSIKMNYAGWDGFQIGGSTIDFSSYSMINFSLYSETGTSMLLVFNEQWGNGQLIDVPAGGWTDYAIPITNVSNGTTILDQFVLQDQSGVANTMYIDQVGFDISFPSPPSFTYEIYLDELDMNVWWNGWTAPETFSSIEQVKSGLFSIKMNYAGWDGFQIGGSGEDLTSYTTVEFSLYSETGTSMLLVLNEQWGNGLLVNVPAGAWTEFVIPISSVANGTTILDQFVIQDQSGVANTMYIDNVGLN